VSLRESTNPTRHPQTFGLALTGGLGIVLIIIALGVGVLQAGADTSVVAVTLVAGLLLLAFSIIGWVVLTKPFQNFDDINVPKYTGHHHEEHHDDHGDEHHDDAASQAIIPHEEAASH
jgi:hypothetical protein